MPEVYATTSVESALLRKCVLPMSDGGQFPNMTSAISFFRNAFDAAPAKRDGVIKPKPGVDPLFDEAKVSSGDRVACYPEGKDVYVRNPQA